MRLLRRKRLWKQNDHRFLCHPGSSSTAEAEAKATAEAGATTNPEAKEAFEKFDT